MMGRQHPSRALACAFAALALLLVLLPGAAAGQTLPAASSDYVIGIGDVLQISVWGHPNLERSVTVDPQGNVTLPPVGDLKASGLTARQLADRITRLSTYLRQGGATVTIVVKEFVSRGVWVKERA